MEEGFKVVNLSGVVPTPNIRTNGNWFVGNEDTGVAAKGETGEQGPQGEKGDQGEIGPTGPQGPQGEKGTDADTSELERLSNEVDTINQSLNGYQITTGNLNTTLSVGWALYTITFNEKLNNSPSFCSFVIHKPNIDGAIRLVYAPQWTDSTNTQATCAIYNADSTTMVVDIEVLAVCKA